MKERILKLAAALPKDVDAVLITAPQNRKYYTGFTSSAGALLVGKGYAALIIDFRYYEKAKSCISGCQVLLQTKLSTQLNALLQQHGVQTLAVESSYITLGDYQNFKAQLPDTAILDDSRVNDIILEQRQIKAPKEIALMKQATDLSQQALEQIIKTIKPGKTERQIAQELEYATRQLGSQRASFDFIVASGPNGSMPHAVPTDKPVENGELITIDFGSTVDGYCSDMTRTFAIGPVASEQQEIYNITLKAQLTAMEAIRAGQLCKDIDTAARDVIAAAGYGACFGHGLGHSIGIEVHESPAFSAISKAVCKTGMVMSVEPGIYIEGKYGCRIEDLVIITENGYENLNNFPKELIIL